MRRTLWVESHWPEAAKRWAYQFNELVTMRSIACLKFFYDLPARLLKELEDEEKARYAAKRARWRDTKSKQWYSLKDYQPRGLPISLVEVMLAHESRDPRQVRKLRMRYAQTREALLRHEEATKEARTKENEAAAKEWQDYLEVLNARKSN